MLLFGERGIEETAVRTASPCATDMQDPDQQAAFMTSERKSPEVPPGSQALANAV